MKLKSMVLGLAAAAAMAGVAHGQDMLTGADTNSILDIAKAYGTARLETRDNGDPQIVGKIGEIRYQLLFRNCTDGSDCEDVQFYAGLLDTKPGLEAMNEYNKTSRFARAYLDDDEDAVIEWDIDLANGVTTAGMEASFDLWSQLIDRFSTKFSS